MTQLDELPPPPAPFFTQVDVREGLWGGLVMLVSYFVGCFLLLALVLVFQDGTRLGVWLKGAVMAAALGLGGRLQGTFDGSESTGDGFSSYLLGGGFSYGFTPLILLALALALAFLLAWRSERSTPTTSHRQAVIRALLSAVVAAGVLAVLARVARLSGSSLGDSGQGGSLGAAVGPILMVSLPVLFVAFAAGRFAQRWRASGRSVAATLRERTYGVSSWFLATAAHAALSSAALTVAGFVYLLVSSTHEVHEATDQFTSDDVSGLVLFLYALPNLALGATGFFQGFSLGSGAETEDEGSTSIGLLTGHVPAQHYAWALIVVASALVVGAVRSLQTPEATVQREWWRAGLGSLAFWGLAALALRVHFGFGPISAGIGFTALTLVPLAFAWGVLMLVAGRAVAPHLQRVMPRLAARVPVVEKAALPSYEEPAPELPPGADVMGWDGPERPVQTRTIAIALTVVAVLLIAGVGYKVADSRLYGPEAAVTDYLDDLAAGRVDAALSRLKSPPSDRTLLTAAALPAESRISKPHVTKIARHGSSAVAHVTYTLGDEEQDEDLLLVRSGSRDVVFHDWLVAQPPGDLHLDGGSSGLSHITLNGIPVPAGDSHPAFPGVYEVDLHDEVLEPDVHAVTVTFEGAEELISPQLSEETQQLVRTAVADYLRSCAAAARSITSCGFDAYVYGDRFENVRWVLTGEPDLSISYENGVISVTSNTPAEARMTGTAITTDFFGGPDTRTPIDETADVYVSGTATVHDGRATFTPS